MMPTTRSRFTLAMQAAAAVALFVFTAVLLFRFPPEQYSFYPQCPIHHYLGILCPGCGTTRALASLLHGNLGEALRLNALTVLLLPIAIGYAVAGYLSFHTRRPLVLPQPQPLAMCGLLAVTVVYTIARNL